MTCVKMSLISDVGINLFITVTKCKRNQQYSWLFPVISSSQVVFYSCCWNLYFSQSCITWEDALKRELKIVFVNYMIGLSKLFKSYVFTRIAIVVCLLNLRFWPLGVNSRSCFVVFDFDMFSPWLEKSFWPSGYTEKLICFLGFSGWIQRIRIRLWWIILIRDLFVINTVCFMRVTIVLTWF